MAPHMHLEKRMATWRAWPCQSACCPSTWCFTLPQGPRWGPAKSQTGCSSLSASGPSVPALLRLVTAAMATKTVTYRAASHAGVL